MPFSRLKQVNVMFGKKQRNGDVTRQCQGGISQKRVWVVFRQRDCRPFRRPGSCSWRSSSFCIDCSGGLAVVQALLCAEPQNLPGCRMAFPAKRMKGFKLETLKKLGKTKCWKCILQGIILPWQGILLDSLSGNPG